MKNKVVIVAGLGEVGSPLLQILSRTYDCIGIDVSPVPVDRPCSVLHVCYPSQIKDFIGVSVAYAEKYKPELIVIHSTVAPGTTRSLQDRLKQPVVFSPVRGKHVKMERDLLHYKKFVAASDMKAAQKAADHFSEAGFQTEMFPSPEVGEVSKLLETTWLGVLIGWAQEVERIVNQNGGNYEDVIAFLKEIDFLPSHVFPGYIGGHCVMPNIGILRERYPSKFLDAVVESNFAKAQALGNPPKENTAAPDVNQPAMSEAGKSFQTNPRS